jgi:hypothetical protein
MRSITLVCITMTAYGQLLFHAMIKTLANPFIIISALLILYSCKEETSQIVSTSPDKKIEIVVSGKKASPLDPFLVDISITKEGENETISTEIYSKTLDTGNVKFSWKSNSECYLTFIQQDNISRRMHLQVNNGDLLLQEE